MANHFTTVGNKAVSEVIPVLLLIFWLRHINQQHAVQVIKASTGAPEGTGIPGGAAGNTGTGAGNTGSGNSDDQDSDSEEVSNKSNPAKETEAQADKKIEKIDAGDGTILNNIGLKDSNPTTDPEDIDLSTGTHDADAATG
jgi:hypothetical protein